MDFLNEILVCPKTKKPLKVDWEKKVVSSNDENIRYLIKDNIIDFIPDVKDYITETYDSISPFYDRMLTGKSIPTRLYNMLVWGMDGGESPAEKLLNLFPDCAGKIIIDIPVGTGIFTVNLYKKINETSKIIAIDYSIEMLKKARKCYEEAGIHNIIYIRADVGNLPFVDDAADILLTMNGYHAFPEKERSLMEMARVVKSGGTVLSSFYVKGERSFTDFFINNVYRRSGSFTPPFYNLKDIREKWGHYFDFRHFGNIRSHALISGIKKNI